MCASCRVSPHALRLVSIDLSRIELDGATAIKRRHITLVSQVTVSGNPSWTAGAARHVDAAVQWTVLTPTTPIPRAAMSSIACSIASST